MIHHDALNIDDIVLYSPEGQIKSLRLVGCRRLSIYRVCDSFGVVLGLMITGLVTEYPEDLQVDFPYTVISQILNTIGQGDIHHYIEGIRFNCSSLPREVGDTEYYEFVGVSCTAKSLSPYTKEHDTSINLDGYIK